MIVLLKKIFNKIFRKKVSEHNPETPFPVGCARCELCGEVDIYDGFTQIKKHICKE